VQMSDALPAGTTFVSSTQTDGPAFTLGNPSEGQNGTVIAAGTVRVKDIDPGDFGSNPNELYAFGNTLFLQANDGIHGFELWKSDGTEAGTTLVKDVLPGDSSSSSSPYEFTAVGGTVFFGASGASGQELWKTDGTDAGTVEVRGAQTATFEIVVSIGENAIGSLSNTATITSDSSDPANVNNSSTATTTVTVPDDVKPQVTVSTPTNAQTLSFNAFNSITGSATDNVGVDQVFIKLFRTRNNVRTYWDGTSFGSAQVLVPATVASNGATSTSWSFAVTPALKAALDDGAYTAYAYAQDTAGNLSTAFTRNFNLYSDDVKPVPSIATPTSQQTLSASSFVSITGSATDNVGVTEVLLKLFRTQNGVVQYWNGEAFTTTSTLFSATVSNPGAKSTNWTYVVPQALKDALTAGPYTIYAYAKDARNNQSGAVSRAFTISSDNTKPSVPVISTPNQGQTLTKTGFTSITGSATDNIGVSQVLLRLYRTRGDVTQYWNGTAFTTTPSTFQAGLTAPNATSTNWKYTVSAALRSALDDGAYGIQAYGKDAASNQSTAASRSFKITVPVAAPDESSASDSSANNS
jgi:ELWxxDGT repeat protein